MEIVTVKRKRLFLDTGDPKAVKGELTTHRYHPLPDCHSYHRNLELKSRKYVPKKGTIHNITHAAFQAQLKQFM